MPTTDPAPDPDAPLFEFKPPGTGVRVYRNRIESWKPGLLPWAPKRETVPLRNVASVDRGPLSGKVVVTTNDGRKHEYVAGFRAGDLRDAILRAL